MRSYFFISTTILFFTTFVLAWADEPENKRTLIYGGSTLEVIVKGRELDDANPAHQKIKELSKKMKEAVLRKDWDAAIELQEQILLLGNYGEMQHQVSGLTALVWFYEQQGKGGDAVIPKWEEFPFKSRAYNPYFYVPFGHILFRYGQFQKAEQFFTQEIALLTKEMQLIKHTTPSDERQWTMNSFHFALGTCFRQRAMARYFQNKNLSSEMKSAILDDIKKSIIEIDKIVGNAAIKKELISKYEGLRKVLNAQPPNRVLLVPKKPQPPLLVVGTAEERWNASVKFDFDVIYIDE